MSNLGSFTSLSLLGISCQKKYMNFLPYLKTNQPTNPRTQRALKNSKLHSEQGKWSLLNAQSQFCENQAQERRGQQTPIDNRHHTEQGSDGGSLCPHSHSLATALQRGLASHRLLPSDSGLCCQHIWGLQPISSPYCFPQKRHEQTV